MKNYFLFSNLNRACSLSLRTVLFSSIAGVFFIIYLVCLLKGEDLFEKFDLSDKCCNYNSLENNFRKGDSLSLFIKRTFYIYVRPIFLSLLRKVNRFFSLNKFFSTSLMVAV